MLVNSVLHGGSIKKLITYSKDTNEWLVTSRLTLKAKTAYRKANI